MGPYRQNAEESTDYDDTKWCAACESQQPVFHDFNRCGKPMNSCGRKTSCDCVECTLRADLARVTAEREVLAEKLCAEDRDFGALRDDLKRAQFNENANWHQAESYRARLDAARAQVRELQKVARAAVAWKHAVTRPMFNVLGTSVVQPLWDAVDALPPSALREVSDG